MKPQVWKIVVLIVGAFVAMAGPILAVLLLAFLGPPPYLLDEDRLGPEWSMPREFPDGSTVIVHNYADAAAAKQGADALLNPIPRSSTFTGPHSCRYTRADDHRRGLLVPIGNRVIQIEAGDDEVVYERLTSLPFLRVNPEKNLMSVLLTEHLSLFFAGFAGYLVLWFYGLFRGGAWAARLPPQPGITPVPAETLRGRLLAINDLNLPFQVREEPSGRLVAQWRIADANWVGILHAGGLHKAHSVHMELDPRTHMVRVLDRDRTVTWHGDVAGVGHSWSFFQGISFFQYEKGAQVGLCFKEGQWTTTAYHYSFRLAEMKNPLIEVITASGWTFAPMVTFFRPLGG
jgi:hypothetical protein